MRHAAHNRGSSVGTIYTSSQSNGIISSCEQPWTSALAGPSYVQYGYTPSPAQLLQRMQVGPNSYPFPIQHFPPFNQLIDVPMRLGFPNVMSPVQNMMNGIPTNFGVRQEDTLAYSQPIQQPGSHHHRAGRRSAQKRTSQDQYEIRTATMKKARLHTRPESPQGLRKSKGCVAPGSDNSLPGPGTSRTPSPDSELKLTMKLRMQELKDLISQADVATTQKEKRELMIRAKAKTQEVEDVNQALSIAMTSVSVAATPSVQATYQQYESAHPPSLRSTWYYNAPQVPQGLIRFVTIPSPETYVIEISDDEEDMEDLEV